MPKLSNYNQAMKRDLLPETHLGLVVERRIVDGASETYLLEYLPFRTPEEVYAYMTMNGLDGDEGTAAAVRSCGLVAASPVKLKVSVDIEPA